MGPMSQAYRIVEAYKQSMGVAYDWMEKQGDFDPGAPLGQIAIEQLEEGEIENALTTVMHGIARAFPRRRTFEEKRAKYDPGLDIIGIGSEAVVVREGDEVLKYLSGKSWYPERLIGEVKRRYDTAKPIMGEVLTDTEFEIREAKLKVGGKVLDYVVLCQPYINVKLKDPQRSRALLSQHDGIRAEVVSLVQKAQELRAQTGLVLDFVQPGNVLWGDRPYTITIPDRTEYADTIITHESDRDILGLWSPGWNVKRYHRFLDKVTDEVLSVAA